MPRTLCFDFGERRIGVAASDPTRTIASPLTTVHRRAGKRPPFTELLEIVREQEADELVVGLPLDLGGDETTWTAEVRAFGEGMATRSGLPVYYMDERMTSVLAERTVRGLGLKRSAREQKERIDAAAAALILEGWLTLRGRRPAEEEGA